MLKREEKVNEISDGGVHENQHDGRFGGSRIEIDWGAHRGWRVILTSNSPMSSFWLRVCGLQSPSPNRKLKFSEPELRLAELAHLWLHIQLEANPKFFRTHEP